MPHSLRLHPLLTLAPVAILLALANVPAAALAAGKGEFRPNPETYICPNVAKLGVDCFLDAVDHLYTMCRQVKSIEIIEFGYDKAESGVNGAKSEYCVDKHKVSIMQPYKAALKQAHGSRVALEALHGLYDVWLKALGDLKWKPPETDDQYKGRIARAYDVFRERASLVRTALVTATPAKRAPLVHTARENAARSKRGTH